MMRILLAALAALAVCGVAIAQTTPSFYPGSAPTLSTWNAYFASKQDLLGFTPVNAAKLQTGTCTMSSGACSAQSFATAYTAAPICVVTWTGTGTLAGSLKVASATGTVTPSSSTGSDSAQVNWLCYGS